MKETDFPKGLLTVKLHNAAWFGVSDSATNLSGASVKLSLTAKPFKALWSNAQTFGSDSRVSDVNSSLKTDTSSPVWEEIFELDVLAEEGALHCELRGSDMLGGNSHIGECEVDLEPLFKNPGKASAIVSTPFILKHRKVSVMGSLLLSVEYQRDRLEEASVPGTAAAKPKAEQTLKMIHAELERIPVADEMEGKEVVMEVERNNKPQAAEPDKIVVMNPTSSKMTVFVRVEHLKTRSQLEAKLYVDSAKHKLGVAPTNDGTAIWGQETVIELPAAGLETERMEVTIRKPGLLGPSKTFLTTVAIGEIFEEFKAKLQTVECRHPLKDANQRPVGTLVINAYFTGLTEVLSPVNLDPSIAEEEIALKSAVLKNLSEEAEESVAAVKEVAEGAAMANNEVVNAKGDRKLKSTSTLSHDAEAANQDVGDPLIISPIDNTSITTSVMSGESGSADKGGEEVAGLAFGGDAIAKSVATHRVANEGENGADDTDQLEEGENTAAVFPSRMVKRSRDVQREQEEAFGGDTIAETFATHRVATEEGNVADDTDQLQEGENTAAVFPSRMVKRSRDVQREQKEAEFVATNQIVNQEGMVMDASNLWDMDLAASIHPRMIERSMKKRSGSFSLLMRALGVLSIIGLFLVAMTLVHFIRGVNVLNCYATPKTWEKEFDAVLLTQKVAEDWTNSCMSAITMPKTLDDVASGGCCGEEHFRQVNNWRDDLYMPQGMSQANHTSPPHTWGEEYSAAALTELAHASTAQGEMVPESEDEVLIEVAKIKTEEDAAAQEEEVCESEEEALRESTEIETEQEVLAPKVTVDQLEDEGLRTATANETEPQDVAQDEVTHDLKNETLREAAETETKPENIAGEDGVYELEYKALNEAAETESGQQALAQEAGRLYEARCIKAYLKSLLQLLAGFCAAYAACLAITRRIKAELQLQVQKAVTVHSEMQAGAQHLVECECAQGRSVPMLRNASYTSLSYLSEVETECGASVSSHVSEAYIELRVEERMAAIEKQVKLIHSTVRILQSQVSYLETARKIDAHAALCSPSGSSRQRAATNISTT